MLFSVLLCVLLASLPRFSTGLFGPFLPTYRDDVPVNYTASILSPSEAADLAALGAFLMHLFVDWPLTAALFLPTLNHSSLPADLVTIPSYAAWDEDRDPGLTIKLHGHLRRQLNVTQRQVDNVINLLLIHASIKREGGWKQKFPLLNTTGYDGIARWRARSDLLVEPVWNASVDVSFPGLCRGRPNISLTTDLHGDFRAFVYFDLTACVFNLSSAQTSALSNDHSSVDLSSDLAVDPDVSPAAMSCPSTILELDAQIFGSPGHVTATSSVSVFIVPPVGLTISSDIDDILRVAEVWNWKQAMLWLVARPYQPWGTMPDILKSWLDGNATHYHYTSDTISVNSDYYIDGTNRFYPRGSFDFRPFTLDRMELINSFSEPFMSNNVHVAHNSTPLSEALNPRYHNLKRLVSQFPRRKFVFIGDTSTSSTCDAYPQLALEHPDQVACILIRNTRATEPADWMASDTYRFRSLPREKYFFFDRPEDLKQITLDHLRDVVAGRATGCFPRGTEIPMQTYQPSAIRGMGFWSLFRGLWYRVRCNLGRNCPFDVIRFDFADYTMADVESYIGRNTTEDV